MRPYATRFISTFLPAPNSGPDFFAFGTAQTLDQDQIVTKIDYSVNPKDRVSFRYMYNNFPQRGVSNNPLDSSWVQDLPTRTQSWNLGYTHIFTPALIIDTHFSHIRNVFGVAPPTRPIFTAQIGLDAHDSAHLRLRPQPDPSQGVSVISAPIPAYPRATLFPAAIS
jgi:hypothetical protein